MKTKLLPRIIIIVIIMLIINSHVKAQFAGGDGSSVNPYQIASAEQLHEIDNYTGATYASNYFVLTNDIDLANWIVTNTDTDIVLNGWKPIGSNGSTFQGNFNGNGYSIKGLWISRNLPDDFDNDSFDDDYIGLFSYVENGTIDRLNIEINTIKGIIGDDNVGGLVGVNKGNITNCHVEGNITGDEWVGGLAGANIGGSISNCSAIITINGRTSVGGLLGDNKGSLFKSYAIGNVTGTDNIDFNNIGGLIGYSEALADSCYASVSVIGGLNDNTGGLIGKNNGNLTNSYATGSVSGGYVVGGLIGINYDDVSGCYATGNVSGIESIGGFTGENHGLLTDSYATGNVTGENMIGGFIGNNEHTLYNCFATGSIVGVLEVGGFAGYNNFPFNSCYASGDVKGTEYVGGLVGKNNDALTNCFATGNVDGVAEVGGLAGINYYPINNCYAAGYVNGTDNVGGLTGENYGGNSSINNSIAINLWISGINNVHRIGGLIDGGASLTTNYASNSIIIRINGEIVTVSSSDVNDLDGADITEAILLMQNTYTNLLSNWNFTVNPASWNIWQNSSRPFLLWQSAPVKLISSNDNSIMTMQTNLAALDSVVVYKSETIAGVWELTHLRTTTSIQSVINWNSILTSGNVSPEDTLYFLSYENNKKASYPVIARLSQNETTWLTNGISSNWNDINNWSNGIPGSDTHVIISKDAQFYPELQPINTITDRAVCNIIKFEAGSEVAKTNLLTYNSAQVDLKVNANQWYMIAPALRDMYAGDHQLDESIKRLHPSVYFQVYQTRNVQTGKPAGSGEWSNPSNNVLTGLNLGMGYAIKVDNGQSNNSDPFTFHFPKDSTSYSYYDWNGNYTYQESGMTRTNNGRFIYEIGSGTPEDPSRAPMNDIFDAAITADHDSALNVYATTIVGNPFMSHLDFIKFHQANNTKIQNSYHIWGSNGTSFESIIDIDGTLISTADDDTYIPPMQSFIVSKINTATALGTLNFTADMSVTRPSAKLRTSQPESKILKISLNRMGKRQSGIALYFKDGESNGYKPNKDVWTFFSERTADLPVLYTLLDGNPASIHTLGNYSEPIELGIQTTKKEALSIEIDNLEDFDSNLNIYLEDREMKTRQNLRENQSYSFQNTTGNVKGRFFLHITNAALPETMITVNKIKMYVENGQIHISSEIDDSIQKIDIFDIQGKILVKKSGLNTSFISLEVPDLKQKIYIVKVQTEKNISTQKIQ